MTRNPAFAGPIASWRALTPDDAPAVTELFNASRQADGAPDASRSVDETRHELDDPGVTLPTDSRGGWSADGRLLAWGSVWCRVQPVTLSRAVLFGDVHPDVRREGVGRALLDWQLDRARERLTRELPAGLPRRVDLFVSPGDAGRAALARYAGLEPIRWFHKMTRSMGEPVMPQPVPAGLEMVAWTDAWSDAALEARNDAWREHWGYEPMPADVWRHLFVDDPAFLRPVSRLAVEDGRVVAFVMATEQATDDAGDGRTAWLDQIGVTRAWRRRGVASALMGSALVALAEEGFRTVALDVDADSPTGAMDLYERHGFRVVRTETLHGRELPAGDGPFVGHAPAG